MHALQIAIIDRHYCIAIQSCDRQSLQSGMIELLFNPQSGNDGAIAPTLAVAAMQQRADAAAGHATIVIRVRAAGAWSPFFGALVQQVY